MSSVTLDLMARLALAWLRAWSHMLCALAATANGAAYEMTARTKLHRIPDRGTYDKATVHSILEEARTCTVVRSLTASPYRARSVPHELNHARRAHAGMGTGRQAVSTAPDLCTGAQCA